MSLLWRPGSAPASGCRRAQLEMGIAAKPPLRPPRELSVRVEPAVERRKNDQNQGAREDEASDHGDRERLLQLRALSQSERERGESKGGREDGHHDGPHPLARSLRPGLRHRDSAPQLLTGVMDQKDRFLADDSDHHDRSDEARDVQSHPRHREGREDARQHGERHHDRQKRRSPIAELEKENHADEQETSEENAEQSLERALLL